MSLVPAAKKAKLSTTSQASVSGTLLALTGPNGHTEPQANDGDSSLIPRAFERLTLTINPEYLSKLSQSGVLGFSRTFGQRHPTVRFYTINLTHFRDQIAYLLGNYLTTKLQLRNDWSNAEVTQEVNHLVPITVDACVTALYARLRPVHKSFGIYANRFNTASLYHKDMELPLPIADAIQNFGTFSPVGTVTNYVCVPVYAENTQNEGRQVQNWTPASYEEVSTELKALGIPLKSIDTRIKAGSSWWTYRPELMFEHADLRCIFPPSNYSDHSAVLASMFVSFQQINGALSAVISHLDDDVNYPVRLREIPPGFQLRAFSALCHAPREEWNQYLLIE